MPTIQEVLEAERERDAYAARAKTLRANLQLECEHAHVIEALYSVDGYHPVPDFRVCCYCGLAEEGWHCGYQILRGEPLRKGVSRGEANLHRVGPVHENTQFVGYYLDIRAMSGRDTYVKAKLAEVLGIGPKVQDTRPKDREGWKRE